MQYEPDDRDYGAIDLAARRRPLPATCACPHCGGLLTVAAAPAMRTPAGNTQRPASELAAGRQNRARPAPAAPPRGKRMVEVALTYLREAGALAYVVQAGDRELVIPKSQSRKPAGAGPWLVAGWLAAKEGLR